MHTISAHAVHKLGIGRNEKHQPTRPADAREPARDAGPVWCAEMAVHHGSVTRQSPRHGARIWRPGGVGKEKQRWQGWRTGLAVEPARNRR